MNANKAIAKGMGAETVKSGIRTPPTTYLGEKIRSEKKGNVLNSYILHLLRERECVIVSY
jgi:hypothetical protein